jgi:LPXTG-motif cell wall-anchored protein
MTNNPEHEAGLLRRQAARTLAGTGGVILTGLLMFGPNARADDCDPYLEICGTTTTTDMLRGPTTTINGPSSTFVGRPGDNPTPPESGLIPPITEPAPPETIPEAHGSPLPITGSDVLQLTIMGGAAVGLGTALVIRSRRMS